MKKGILISAVVLSTVIIVSCATDRIRGVRNDDLACKTPQSKYDYGRNLPTRAITSTNRRYSRFALRASWNNNLSRYASKKITRMDKESGTVVHDQLIIENYNPPALASQDRQMIDQLPETWPVSNLYQDQLEKLRDPAGTPPESKETVITPFREEIPILANKAYNDPVGSFDVPGQENINASIPKEFSDKNGLSVQNAEKPDWSPDAQNPNSEAFVLMMALLAGLIPFAVIKANPNFATNISFWAAMNPWKTRLMFAGTNIAMITGGLMLGENLADSGIHFSGLSRYLLMGTFFASSLLYPVRHSSNPILKHSYSKQKAFDLAVAISGFMLIVNAGNDPAVRASLTSMLSLNNQDHYYKNTISSFDQAPQNLLYYQPVEKVQDEPKTPEEEKKIRNKKIGNTVLVSLLAVLAAFGVAVGACALSCNGMAGLAALVGIGGGGLVIGLTIHAIRRIWRPKPGKTIKSPADPDPLLTKGTLRA